MVDNGVRTKENPFSFRNFLRNNSDGDTSPVRRKKKDDGSEDADNPFSFRKFLNQGKSPESRLPQSHGSNVSITSSASSDSCYASQALRIRGSSIDNDSNCSQELPDFIQDHLEQVTESRGKDNLGSTLNSAQNSLDQTYCHEDLYSSPLNDIQLDTSATSCTDTFASESYEENFENEECRNRLIDDSSCCLPDFISGTLQSESIVLPSSEDSANSVQSTTSLSDELCALREENTILHNQLEEATQKSECLLERIAELEDKLNELTDKETQETAALEKMVQQVEFNLQVTTDRAIKAEVQVSKLKQEMKVLQAQMKSMAKENKKLNSTCSIMERETIAEKADSIALQIKTAADNAEQPLRTMLEGLEQLRFLSSLVADIGKIQEVD